ncbi:uncharacterized protein LOC107039119 [Diachasma alloeum]|uniref:uncharacterized protein LOC107039119 n=1 Tax=Diachasma alloeum TaxID=454923 RepID=UPI0010FB38A4|nr:uncharacterized protein LOC107039119 [Diachasma alloeum]
MWIRIRAHKGNKGQINGLNKYRKDQIKGHHAQNNVHKGDNEVPDYEITGIHWPRDQKSSVKDGTGMYLKAFGKNIQLWLTPADRALAGRDTPVYSLVSGGWGPILMKYTKVIKTVERFEDLEKSAVLVISQRSDNSRAMIGTIASENLVITPIPERLVDEVKRRRRSVDDVPESEQDDHHYHIVYKGSPVDDRYSDSFMSKRNTANLWTAQLPENMDLGECSRAHRRYFENPKFRLNIAGIVLTEDAEALEYMTTNVIDESTIEAFKTLDGSESYWYARKADIPFDNYDVIVTMTSTNMCSFPSDIMNGVCESGILGVANVGAACTGSDFRGELLNVAIVQDQSAFNRIHTAAHELAHLFGAKHDEISRTHECSPDDGYIMSSGPRLNDKSSQWSSCTVKDIQEFLDTHPKCLNNKINQRKILPVYLPGRFMNAHEQCHRLVGTKACKTAASICWALSCKDLLWEDCMEMRHPAADGTTCGSGKICLYGECVDESTVYA